MSFVHKLATRAFISASVVAASSIGMLADPAMGNETITYNYDAKGRLVLVTHDGDVNDNLVASYTFDEADNRKTLNVTGSPN